MGKEIFWHWTVAIMSKKLVGNKFWNSGQLPIWLPPGYATAWMLSLTVERNHINEVKQFDEMLQDFMTNVKKDMKLVDKLELTDSFGKLNEKDIDIFEYFRETKKEIHYALCDAIDTSRVMDLFSKLIDKTTKYFYETHEKVNAHLLRNIHEFIFKLLNFFGLNYD
jgi:cysteinyl-tRNA synthetase